MTEVRLGGLEPPTQGLGNPCSILTEPRRGDSGVAWLPMATAEAMIFTDLDARTRSGAWSSAALGILTDSPVKGLNPADCQPITCVLQSSTDPMRLATRTVHLTQLGTGVVQHLGKKGTKLPTLPHASKIISIAAHEEFMATSSSY